MAKTHPTEGTRVWFVAYSQASEIHHPERARSRRRAKKRQGNGANGLAGMDQNVADWENFPTKSPICRRDDGFSSRLDGITFPKWRNESIKAYGNAIVPQVALEIFKAIQEYETNI